MDYEHVSCNIIHTKHMAENLAPSWDIVRQYNRKPSKLFAPILVSDIPSYEKNISKTIHMATDHHATQLNKTRCFHFPTPPLPLASSYIRKKKDNIQIA